MRYGVCRTASAFIAATFMVAMGASYATESDLSVAFVSDEEPEGPPAEAAPTALRLPPVEQPRVRPALAEETDEVQRTATAQSNESQSAVVQAVHNGAPHGRSSTAQRRRPPRRMSRTRTRARTISRRSSRTQPNRAQPKKPTSRAASLLVGANQLSQTAKSVEEFTEIIGRCEKALELAVSDEATRYAKRLASWALNRRGQLRAEQDQTQAALHDFMTAVQHDPQRWRAIHNRGVSRAQLGQFATAFDDFTETIRLQPNYAKAYSNRGTLYLEAGEAERARTDFDRATSLDDGLVNAQYGRGRACAMLGEFGLALQSFDAALALNADNADSYCGRGHVYAELGEYDSALSDYAMAIQLDPEFVDAYRQGAWLLATCPDDTVRDADNALLGAQRALDLSGQGDHQLLDTLAAAFASAGEFDSAVDALQQALADAPDDVRPMYRSRLQLYQRGIPYRMSPPPVNQAVFVGQP